MVSGMRTIYPRGLNKGFSSKFREDSRLQQEGSRLRQEGSQFRKKGSRVRKESSRVRKEAPKEGRGNIHVDITIKMRTTVRIT